MEYLADAPHVSSISATVTVDVPLLPPVSPRRTRGTLPEWLIPDPPAGWKTAQWLAETSIATGVDDAKARQRGPRVLPTQLVRASLAGPRASVTMGETVRGVIEAYGGSWDELARFLSSRYDLFDPAFCDALVRAHIPAHPMSADSVADVFQQDFNRALDSVVADFDEQPIWSRGISQLHEATLRRTGERVWMQVQRPDADGRVAADIKDLEKLFNALGKVGGLKHAPWQRSYRELRARLQNNLDYRYTAYMRARLWARARRQPGAHAPRVFRRLCSRRVLIMERLDGVSLAWVLRELDVNPDGVAVWFEANNIKPKKLARRFCDAFLRELIENATVVTDLRTERILLLRNSHFGLMPGPALPLIQLDAGRVRAFRGLIRHLPERSYSNAYADLLGMVEPLPQIDPVELKKKITRDLRAWGQRDAVQTLPPEERTLTALFISAARLFRHRRIVWDVNVAGAILSLRMLESAMARMHPRLGRVKLLEQFFVRSATRMARAATRSVDRARAVSGPAPVNSDAPYDMMDQTERYAESVSEQSLQFANTASKPAFLFEKLFAGLRFLIVVAALASVLCFVDQDIDRIDTLRGVSVGRFLSIAPAFSLLEYLIMAVVEVWLFVLFHRITVRFRAKDSDMQQGTVV
jgi:predicted unusual protein kinase regulating ubiquinone biosynthesis (AarF/ABC1/UbiB family)